MTEPVASAGRTQPAVLAVAGFALVLWGGTAIANRAAALHMDPISAGVLRSLLAGLIATVIALMLRLPRPASARDWMTLMISGFASFAFWPMLLSLGLGATTANHAAFIMALIPIFTGLIASAVERRLPGGYWWVGVGLALVGTVALVTVRDKTGGLVDQATLGGDLIIVSGAAICAAGYVAGGRLSARIGAGATTFWGLSMAVLIQLPVFLILMPKTDWEMVAWPGWAGIAYMTFCSSLIGYACWFWALGRGGVARIGALQFAQPVLTVLLAAPILGEPLTWPLAASGAVILAGAALTQRMR